MNNLFKLLQKPLNSAVRQRQCLSRRFYAAPARRFYRNTSVVCNNGKYEVILDQRKLKTPNGTIFTVNSEPLAIAVANEFDSQLEYIELSKMHLSLLCFTALDNPNKLTKMNIVDYLLDYIATDTILYQSENEKHLVELEFNEWDPVLKWFNKRFNTNIQKTLKLTPPLISAEDKLKISKYLSLYSLETLHGIAFAVDTLKSVILACAVIEQQLINEKAVALALLEEAYQLKFWGRIEWAHDLSQQYVRSRLAAAALFVRLNRSESFL
ncbi:ATP synthase mitochondrial F1 complex assembly factor 2-like [Teleopsis dalmanni]|uniref:ATP synthase mitochondrial F1 complex assembly factor 2-like n=1 Tax=Teleopsis dalmanni TaxID=139649 RepID=UPI0018CD1C26|nr:ATP synthase mitochondrial F1 complex assembly factor 2-like [Teleopsis dalmanni]